MFDERGVCFSTFENRSERNKQMRPLSSLLRLFELTLQLAALKQ